MPLFEKSAGHVRYHPNFVGAKSCDHMIVLEYLHKPIKKLMNENQVFKRKQFF